MLVIGSGGREHALVLALARDPQVAEIHAAPGNPGTALHATNHAVDAQDGPAVAALASELGVNLVVIGPEAPLVAGVADAVRAAGIACFGPSAAAARIEGSKAFAKEVMAAAGVPTARRPAVPDADEVDAALAEFGPPYVVKDDGLAAGKGVVVTEDRAAARTHALAAGRVVIEEFLDGPEVSLFAITDGPTVRAMQPAQDFKRVGRRRPRPEHRRHGGLHAAALGAGRPGRRGHGHGAAAHRGRAGPAGHALRRAALRRAGPDRAAASG